MLAKALKLADADGQAASNPEAFTDQAEIRPWARDAVSLAIHAGIIRGYEDGSFRPSGNVTRAEMATMLARATGLPIKEGAATPFADDEQIPVWAKGAVTEMQEQGIVTGRADQQFAPNDTATRAEAVTMILRLLGFKG